MSRIVAHTNESRSFYPVSLDDDYKWASTSGTQSNMFDSADSTSYYQINFTTGSGAESWWWLVFNCTGWIPDDATINSVALSYKVYRTGSSSSQINTKTYQMYVDSTGKGTAQAIINSQNSAQTLNNPGTWTASELNNKKVSLYSYIKRGTSNTSTNYYARVYGATFTVNASWNETQYQVTGSSQSGTSASISIPLEYTTAGGDITVTINNVSDILYLGVMDNGVNVANQLVHTSGSSYTYTISNISEDHTLTLVDTTAYDINIVNNSSSISSLDPPVGTGYKTGESSDYPIEIYIDNPDKIYIYDNNVKSTQQLTEVNPVIESSVKVIPSVLSDSAGTVTDGNNGLADSESSNYATVKQTSTTNAGYLIYDFNISAIPSGATIKSISCKVKASINPATFSGTKNAQLIANGTTIKTVAVASTNVTTYNLNAEDLDINNLSSLQIEVYFKRSQSGTVTMYFYGADATIEYEYLDTPYYVYTIQNVQTNHTVRFEDRPIRTITCTSEAQGVTISSSAASAYEDTSVTLTLDASDINDVYVLANDTDITSQFSGSSGSYTCSLTVQGDQTIVVRNAGAESSQKIYIKANGSYVLMSKVFKKVSGLWVEQSNFSNLFDPNQIYNLNQ